MPSASWYPIYELLTRHGIDHDVAKSNAVNDLRAWNLDQIAFVLKKIKRPSREYCYFRGPSITTSTGQTKSRKLWPSLSQSSQTKWISPPRALMEQSARDESALCINQQGQWSLRTSNYVALSHVWIEGLQRDETHNGLDSQKVDAIFALLRSRAVQAEWVWTDVLAIPQGGGPSSTVEDETLKIDIINTMPQVYSRADAVIIIDALVLQLHTTNQVHVAIAIACGKWATRVWTYQEIKLANRALILTATGSFEFKDVVDILCKVRDVQLEGVQARPLFHPLYLCLGRMMKDEARGISIPDILMSCGARKSGQDVDYARAFFPVLGLKWEYGMTRAEGMQKIYTSYQHHSTRIACFYGAPRLNIMPAWAPSAFNGLEGYVTEPMQWEKRGIRGEWYSVKVTRVEKTFVNCGRFVFEFAVDCPGDKTMQCACAPNEDEKVSQAFANAVNNQNCYVLSAQPSSDALDLEFSRVAMLVERAEVNECDGFEAAVYCAAILPSRSQHLESKETVLLRHWSPLQDGDLHNQVHYLWHTQEGNSLPSTLPRQEGESELHAAVRGGILTSVIDAIERGESIDSFDTNGWTPLHTAAARGNAEILRYLLCHSPDIEIKGKQMNKNTPLSYAALNGQTESIEILLEFGANVHSRDDCDYSPIMVAANERHADVIRMLIKGGANPDDESGFSGTALLLASGAGRWRLPTLQALIEGGANVKPPHSHGYTPMHKVAEYGGEDEMAYLLEQGCEADGAQWDGSTPLLTAILKSKRECVRLLLDAGADRNRRFKDNYRPVHYAANCPNWQIIQMLLENKDVELDARTEPRARTALHFAHIAKNTMVVKMLLNAGADPNVRDADGKTPSSLDQPSVPVASPPLAPRPITDAAPPPLPPRERSNEGPPLPPRPPRETE